MGKNEATIKITDSYNYHFEKGNTMKFTDANKTFRDVNVQERGALAKGEKTLALEEELPWKNKVNFSLNYEVDGVQGTEKGSFRVGFEYGDLLENLKKSIDNEAFHEKIIPYLEAEIKEHAFTYLELPPLERNRYVDLENELLELGAVKDVSGEFWKLYTSDQESFERCKNIIENIADKDRIPEEVLHAEPFREHEMGDEYIGEIILTNKETIGSKYITIPELLFNEGAGVNFIVMPEGERQRATLDGYVPEYTQDSITLKHIKGIITDIATESSQIHYAVKTSEGNIEQVNGARLFSESQADLVYQMIEEGMPSEQIDMMAYSVYSAEQMEELKTGFREDLSLEQVSQYADPQLNADKMRLFRFGQQNYLSNETLQNIFFGEVIDSGYRYSGKEVGQIHNEMKQEIKSSQNQIAKQINQRGFQAIKG